MAAAVELATGYVTLTVETSQVSKAIGKAFNAGETIAVTAGQKMGKAVADGLKKIETKGLDKLQEEFKDAGEKAEQAAAKVKASEDRLAATIEQASRKRANARTQVEIAEQRLVELQEKGTATASQLMTAEDKVTRARQKYADVSRAGIGSITAFQKEVASSKDAFAKAEAGVDEARSALKKFESDAKASADEAERSGGRFSRAFSGVKDKIKASFNGAFDSAKAEAKDAGDTMEREFRDAGQKAGGGFKESFKGAFAGLAAYVGVQEVIGGFKTAILNAGDLEQSRGALDSVFKEYSAQMHGFSRTAAETVGLSSNEFNELATTLGALLKNGGTPLDELGDKTSSLIQLGSDLASMYGGTTAEAVEAISSALKGEMDPIERYGISLNDATLTQLGLTMGIEKTSGAFTDQQKKLLVQAALFKQSADAQGNFARESDTFSHKLEVAKAKVGDLSAKIGQALLPAMTEAFGWLGDVALPALEEFAGGIQAFFNAWSAGDGEITSSGFAGTMEELAGTLRKGYDTMVEWYPVWMPFASGVAAVTGTFVAYKVALQAVATAQGIMTAVTTAWQIITGVQTGTLWGLTAAQWAAITPIALTIGALVALAVGIKMAYEHVGWFRDLVDTAWAWIKNVISGVVDWFTGTVVPAFQGALAAIGEWFTDLYRDYIAPVWDWVKQSVSDVVSWFTDVAAPAIGGALSAVGEWFSGLYTDYVEPAWALIKDSVSAVTDWFTGVAAPAVGEAVRVLGDFFMGLYTGFIQPAFSMIAQVATWLYETIIKPVWTAIMVTVTMVAAILLTIFQGIAWIVTTLLGPVFVWLYESVIKPVWGFIQGAIAGFVTWWQDTAVPFIQAAIGILALAWETYKDQLALVWDWVTSVIQGFLDWWANTAVPFIQAAVAILQQVWEAYKDQLVAVWNFVTSAIQGFLDWWNGVAVPFIQAAIAVVTTAWQAFSTAVGMVWDWISSKISAVWSWVQNSVLAPAKAFLENVLAPAFIFLWTQVSNVWTWISDKISFTWNFVRGNILDPLVTFLDKTVGEAFRTLWRTVEQVWTWISDKITAVWDWLKNSVLKPLGDYITTTFVGFFEAAKDGIGRVWSAIKDVVREPVRFVIDTVINGGVIKNYNKLNDFWGGDDLDEMKFPEGFARGGVLPGYQSAKKDELLVPMRKGEGVIVPEATRALGHSFIYGINAAANSGGLSGASSWLSQNFGGGYATGGVISPLKQRYPLSQGYNRVHKGIDIATPIGTPIYATADGIITHAGAGARAPGVWGGNEIHVKSGGLERWFAHLSEIAVRVGQMVRQGDYLGKTGNTGISSGPHLHFGVFNGGWPNDIDPLSYLGGAVNFDASDLSGTGGGGGGSSIIGFIAEKLTAPVRALLDTAKQKFGGNVFADIPFNIAQKTLDSVVTWVGSKFGGSESSGMSTNWEPTVRDALARAGLPVRDDYVGAWLRQIQSESGGNPRAVQNGYTDINTITGDLAQGLVQVIGSTFQAYRDPSLPNDRFDPLANLVAGMRYAKARYGASMLNVIGHGHGYALGGIVGEPPALYDKGGLITRGVQLIDHQRSTPDYVLTDKQWAAMYEIAQSTASAQQGQAAIQIGSVHGYTAEEVGAQIEKERRQKMALAL